MSTISIYSKQVKNFKEAIEGILKIIPGLEKGILGKIKNISGYNDIALLLSGLPAMKDQVKIRKKSGDGFHLSYSAEDSRIIINLKQQKNCFIEVNLTGNKHLCIKFERAGWEKQ